MATYSTVLQEAIERVEAEAAAAALSAARERASLHEMDGHAECEPAACGVQRVRLGLPDYGVVPGAVGRREDTDE